MSAESPRTPASLRAAVTARRARRALASPLRIWRRSLRGRTLTITVLLASLALLAVGTVVSYTIARGLFEDRRSQVLAESARATAAAQTIANGVSSDDSNSLNDARLAAYDSVKT